MNRAQAPVAARLATTLALLLFVIVVPVLEANSTHLLHPQWPPHARLHEAWQLITNASLGLLAIRWAWRPGRLAAACSVGGLLSGSFLLAWSLRDGYGGSMHGTTSAALSITGVDAAVAVMGCALALFAGLGWTYRRLPAPPA